MNNITESFAFWMTLIGMIIGVLMPSPLIGFIENFDPANITLDNSDSITGAFIGYPIALAGEFFIRIITGFMIGAVGLVIGLLIDIANSGNNLGGLP